MAAFCKIINEANSAPFEILRAVLLRVGVVWVVALPRWVNICGRFDACYTALTFGTG
jgi:hypothetical protein